MADETTSENQKVLLPTEVQDEPLPPDGGAQVIYAAQIISGRLIIGNNSSSVFKADPMGIYLGNAIFASAPFRVDASGNLFAQNMTITGNFLIAPSGSAEFYNLSTTTTDQYSAKNVGVNTANTTTPVEVERFTFPSDWPANTSASISFVNNNNTAAGQNSFSQIYINGVAVGATFTLATTGGANTQTNTQTLTVNPSDIVAVYGWQSNLAFTSQITNFRILGTVTFNKYNIT